LKKCAVHFIKKASLVCAKATLRNETLKCKESKAQAESKGKLHKMQREFYIKLVISHRTCSFVRSQKMHRIF